MNVYDKEIFIPFPGSRDCLREVFSRAVLESLGAQETPIRFAVTKSDDTGFQCEAGILVSSSNEWAGKRRSIFEFQRRSHQNAAPFGVALIIPTGVDCSIGGHSGDAGPVARLLAACCDRLVLHPNVVNAADINELPENALYVEGSILTRLLMGAVGLVPVRANRVLLIADLPEDHSVAEYYINMFSAARATLGLHGVGVHCLSPSFRSRTVVSPGGRASGTIDNLERLLSAVRQHDGEFDVLAIASVVDIPDGIDSIRAYFTRECANPWGGVEAMITHAVSHMLDIPSAHAPIAGRQEMADMAVGVVDPRKAAEVISLTELYCVLKGLHRSPRLLTEPADRIKQGVINAEDISCLVQPAGCLGLPTLAALEQGMTVIAVRENHNVMKNDLAALPFRAGQFFMVDNYLEAAGLLAAIKAGVDPATIRRPFAPTRLWGFPSDPGE